MKRAGNLIAEIATLDNLYLAYCKAKRGKALKSDVIEFDKNLKNNILNLQQQIKTGDVKVGAYHYFTIFDPKERIICAAAFSERVLHHALMNVCHDNFEQFQIVHSYASRVGKGTYAALEQARLYQKKYAWFLKLDVRKYFDSIDHEVLKSLLARRFKDKRLLCVFDKIIDSYNSPLITNHLSLITINKGLPIGNLTSQYFANHYLAVADHFIKENLRIPAYVRYMDDMVMWSDNKAELLFWGQTFQRFLTETLHLELKPFCLNRCHNGLPFLGYRLYKNRVMLSNQSKKRFVGKFKRYTYYLNHELWNEKVYQRHILPLLAFANHADTKSLRTRLLIHMT